jgi:protoporphyrinogen oxidase
MITKPNKKVAVVGGGWTGLTAAYDLAKKGYEVEIFEAGPVLGGIVSGFSLKDGTSLERVYHFLYTTDNFMISMAKELGIFDKLHFYPSTLGAFYKGKLYPFTTGKDLMTFGPLNLIDRIRTGITGLRLLLVRKWQPLTKITAYEWLCKWNGKRAADLIWKPLLVGKFDVYWDKITMAWLWYRIHVLQTSKKKGGHIQRLGYFDGGFQIMIKRWQEELVKQNVKINLNAKIEIFTEDNGKPSLKYNDKIHNYDAIIAAIPSNTFARLGGHHPKITKNYIQSLNSIDYLGAVLLVFTTKKPITDKYWHQIHDEDSPFLVLLSLDSLVGTEKINGHHVYYIGDYTKNNSELMNLSDDQIRACWFAGVKKFFPKFDENFVEESYVNRFKNAQHIVDVTYEDRIPAMRTPLSGFYLANFSQIFPEDRGTNYAVREGHKVAKLVREDLEK